MPISCEPEDLADASTCFYALSWRQRKMIRVYLLCLKVNSESAASCDPNDLAIAAACYDSLSDGQLDAIETFLVCSLVP